MNDCIAMHSTHAHTYAALHALDVLHVDGYTVAMTVTEQQIDDALQQFCMPESGGWSLPLPNDGWRWYELGQARAMVRVCLVLGVPVTGTPGVEAWAAVVARLEDVEQRLPPPE